MTAISDRIRFEEWAEASCLHRNEADPDVAELLALNHAEPATVAENTGYETDRELAIMRRFPGWPEAYR